MLHKTLTMFLDVPQQHWEMSQFDREGHFVYEASTRGDMEVLAHLQRRHGCNWFKNADLIIKLQFFLFFPESTVSVDTDATSCIIICV